MGEPHVVVIVARELEGDFDQYKHLLPSREVSRQASDDGQYVVVTMGDPHAPVGAVSMLPIWSVIDPPEHRVELDTIEYYDADGHQIV